MKKTALVLCLFLALLLAFTGCSGIGDGEAQNTAADFLEALEDRDFDRAEKLLHPHNDTDLEAYLNMLQEEIMLKYKDLEIQRYEEIESEEEETVSGDVYNLRVHTLLEEHEVSFNFKIVRNDEGFGIYDFSLVPQKNFGIKLP